MHNFETRLGPYPQVQYPTLEVPKWYRDAKLGLFVHWGLYSVPAWAITAPPAGITIEDAYIYHQYAEWYANTVRFLNSPTRIYHRKTFSEGTSYEDLAAYWRPHPQAVANIVKLALRAGVKYVIPTTKHHDGFCLWDTATTTFNAVKRGPQQDIIAQFAQSARAAKLRFGVYFSGAHDWHVADFPPISSDKELFTYRRNDPAFARYSAQQLRELINNFSPDILWNDIEWPDAGKDEGPDSIKTLFTEYLAKVPQGVVNDRWGVPAHGYLTREYSRVSEVITPVWEATRGLGSSFGYNQLETTKDYLSAPALVELLVEVVAKNGNLLINVGPKADGTVVPEQVTVIEHLGDWLAVNGAAIYATRPWTVQRPKIAGVHFTCSPAALDSSRITHVHVIITAQAQAYGRVPLPVQLCNQQANWLVAGATGEQIMPALVENGQLEVPNSLRSDFPLVASFTL